jgi:exodeoxyribonuclease VII large subunit
MEFDDSMPLFQRASTPVKPRETAKVMGSVMKVSELNRRVKNMLEANLELLWVGGELSNVMRAASGHWYFSLKDESAQVRCVMFRGRASHVSFTPENGMQVEVRALPSLYEARGEFQLGVETMRRAGLGALFEAFEKLKAKLSHEGLFDADRKKTLPIFPRAIGVVTSLKAAALRDVLTTLQRRAPMIPVIIYPTSVQGAAAPAEIAKAIDAANARAEIDTLIICRGGGSIEDLWAFNDETVARAIVRLQTETDIAVVSGVGHETDFTICDFVADQRAPTPTAAAELVSPNRADLLDEVAGAKVELQRTMQRRIENTQQRLDRATRTLTPPHERLARERDRLTHLQARARHALDQQYSNATYCLAMLRQRLAANRPEQIRTKLVAHLEMNRIALKRVLLNNLAHRHNDVQARKNSLTLLSPLQVLERGYSIVERSGKVIRDAASLNVGDAISIRVAAGSINADVTSTENLPQSVP